MNQLVLVSQDQLGQSGADIIQVADNAQVGHAEDGSLGVLVDADDEVGGAHAGQVLDSAGDAAGNIQLGADGLAGLANLMGVGDPASVNGSTGGADNAAQSISQRLDGGLEALGAAQATAAGHDDVGAFQVDLLALFLDGLQNLDADLVSGEGVIVDFDLAGAGEVRLHLLVHAGTAGAQLGEGEGAKDGGHQVAAEGGTSPGNTASLFVDVQRGAVSGQAGLQTAGHTGAKVAAQRGSAHQHGIGAVLLDSVHDGSGVSVGAVVIIDFVVHDDDLVGAIGEGFLNGLVALVANDQADGLAALDGSQTAAGVQQLQANVSGLAVLGFNKDPQVIALLKSRILLDTVGLIDR